VEAYQRAMDLQFAKLTQRMEVSENAKKFFDELEKGLTREQKNKKNQTSKEIVRRMND